MIRREVQYLPYIVIMKGADGHSPNPQRHCLKEDILCRVSCLNFYVALAPSYIFFSILS